MAIMYITEYEDLARDNRDSTIQAGQEPGSAEQAITYTTTVASAAFNPSTRFVRIKCNAAAFLEFGVAPTATTANSTHVSANIPEFFGVKPGHKVAAYDGSS